MGLNMTKLSANLGFLWTELSLPDAIRAAKRAGFVAVECHWPYDVPPADIIAALKETGLPMLGLNTSRGDTGAGDNGLSAIPGREAEARAAIDEAVAYAAAIECANIHVMAGFTDRGLAAEDTFRANLAYACAAAAPHGITILIEPLNNRDAPGYHLADMDAAIATINAVGASNLKAMFDCYHIQIMQGDLAKRLAASLPYIGHIQIAAVPDRGEPDTGEVNYAWLLPAIDAMGWGGHIGAEYKPRAGTDAGLGWMAKLGL
ncbi:MAG: hydroxypyruvate isomerase [Paracoccaceae bacterium]|jgi:hydroxypyruvate isomerase